MRKLAIFASAFAVAAALYVWLLPRTAALICGAVLAALGIVLCFFHADTAKRIRIGAFGLAVGLLWSWGYELIRMEPLRRICGEDVPVSAEISGYPEKTKYGCRVEAEISGGRALVYLDNEGMELRPGDRITMQAEVADVSRGSGDDENLYYQSKNISLLVFQNEEPKAEIADKILLKYRPASWARAARNSIQELFPEDTAGFVQALLTGDKSGLSYNQRNQFSITGISHAFAVSGMHVSLIVGAVLFLVRRRRLAAMICIPVMFLFAAMLGFTPSVTRAVIMNTVLLLAPVFKKENDPATTLSFALLVILLGNPWAIANVSLQLSFSAMAGIFLFTPQILNRMLSWRKKKGSRFADKIYRAFAASLSTSLGALSLTTPIAAACFGTVSLIGPLTNLLLLWLISTVFVLSLVTLLAGLFAPAGRVLALGLSWVIRFIMWAVRLLSRIPFASVYTESPYIIAWLAGAYIMFFLFLLIKQERRLRNLLCAVLAGLFCALGFTMADTPAASFAMLDVGEGQSLLFTRGNFTVMVDCGGDNGDACGEMATRKLLTMGHSHLNALILTHYDADHTCGLEQLADRVQIDSMLLPDIKDDRGRREEVKACAEREQIGIRFVTDDLTLSGDGFNIELYAPVSRTEDNDGLCALMSAGDCDILITGDMDLQAEKKLMETHTLPDVDILVAGHHGSKYSTGAELLAQTRPEIVLVSCGKNSYGHPAPEVLDRAAAAGAKVYCTEQYGELKIMR